jgi:nucleoside 2-deoxyribosyltransferase
VISSELPAGGDLKNAVRRGIRDADAVILLLTPQSLASDWTMTELGFAEGFDRRVIPVTVGIAKRDLPAPLKTYKTVPFDRLDEAIRQLSASFAEEAEVGG